MDEIEYNKKFKIVSEYMFSHGIYNKDIFGTMKETWSNNFIESETGLFIPVEYVLSNELDQIEIWDEIGNNQKYQLVYPAIKEVNHYLLLQAIYDIIHTEIIAKELFEF